MSTERGRPCGVTEHPVTRLRPEEVAEAADVLAEAFIGYAWTSWSVPQENHRARLTGLFEVTLGGLGLPFGRVWASRCVAERRIVGVVAALASDRDIPAEVWPRLSTIEDPLLGDRLAANADAERLCAALRPRGEHLTLATMGVAQDHRRRGLGGMLVSPVLAYGRELGLPTYLETSTEENVALYRRCGFEVTGRLEMPDGGPTVWAMLHE